MAKAPSLRPFSPHTHILVDDTFSDHSQSNNASARNSTHGSDGIFDKYPLRSPITGSESEYEDEDDIISQMPADSNAPSCYEEEIQEEDDAHSFTQRTPSRKSPFRNPSSVRGMQLDTTPPHLRSPTLDSISKHHGRLSTGSRNSTPRSVQSYRSRSPTKIKVVAKKENPLVLLHVTILPISCSYSQALLQEVAPPHILANWKLLREKVPDTVLERGILIPHPREEFELLEERLLESLELAVPKILKCGHYHRETATNEECNPEQQRRTSQISLDPEDNESDTDSDICTDCTRHIRDGTHGSNGTGTRRWNIHIYAANGLMRSGAWTAAWKEMERVDVEISPWLDDDLRRTLDLRRAQDEEGEIALQIAADEEQHQHQHQQQQQHLLHHYQAGMDESRRREIYGDTIHTLPPNIRTERNFTPGEIVEAYEHSPVRDNDNDNEYHHHNQQFPQNHPPNHTSAIKLPKRQSPSSNPSPRTRDIPITQLLTNYTKLLIRDPRNIALSILSVLVLFLALRTASVPVKQVVGKAMVVPEVIIEAAGAVVVPAVEFVEVVVVEVVEEVVEGLERVVGGIVGVVDEISGVVSEVLSDEVVELVGGGGRGRAEGGDSLVDPLVEAVEEEYVG